MFQLLFPIPVYIIITFNIHKCAGMIIIVIIPKKVIRLIDLIINKSRIIITRSLLILTINNILPLLPLQPLHTKSLPLHTECLPLHQESILMYNIISS